MSAAILIMGLAFLVSIVALRRVAPRNALNSYFTPRFLKGEKQPKSVIRQVGTAWLVWSVWTVTMVVCLFDTFPKHALDENPLPLGLLMFVSVTTSIILHIVGWYYLAIGVFSKGKEIRPGLQSMDHFELDRLEHDVTRLGTYSKVNLSTLVIGVTAIATEVVLNVEPVGVVPLANVALLITFILSLWRLRYHLARSLRGLAAVSDEPLPTNIANSPTEFIIWYDAYRIRKYYKSLKERQNPPLPTFNQLTKT